MTAAHPPAWYAGMDEDTIRRAKASDATLQGIIDGRRRAALATLALDPQPARDVSLNTAALLGEKYAGWVPRGIELPSFPPRPPGNSSFVGHGFPPQAEDVPEAKAGDWYLDQDTGLLYELEG